MHNKIPVFDDYFPQNSVMYHLHLQIDFNWQKFPQSQIEMFSIIAISGLSSNHSEFNSHQILGDLDKLEESNLWPEAYILKVCGVLTPATPSLNFPQKYYAKTISLSTQEQTTLKFFTNKSQEALKSFA